MHVLSFLGGRVILTLFRYIFAFIFNVYLVLYYTFVIHILMHLF